MHLSISLNKNLAKLRGSETTHGMHLYAKHAKSSQSTSLAAKNA